MTTLINVDGTSWSDELEYTQEGTYHANGGSDQVLIKAGNKVRVFLDRGNNQVEVTSGADHEVRITEDVAAGNQIPGSDTLTICGADRVTAYLGSGKDTIDISKSDGRKAGGAWSQLRGGEWNDIFKVGANATHYHLYGENGNDSFEVNGGNALSLWGGSGRDSFVVKGGTNNKLYGGDSEDTFDIYAAKQIIYMGYGGTSSKYDIVNIYAGDYQTIYGNLGVNKINLLSGWGHEIKADIDKTVSRNKGFTEAQVNQGIGVGYGVDNILIEGASGVTAHTGDGKDVIVVKSGTRHSLHTEGWGDVIQLEGNISSSTFDAGTGNDQYLIMDWTKIGSNNVIDQTTAGAKDKDSIVIRNAEDKDFTFTREGKDLTLKHKATGKVLKILGWVRQEGESSIQFDNSTYYGEENNTLDLTAGSQTINTGGGNDIVKISGRGKNVVYTGDGNDEIIVQKTTYNNNKIYAGAGADRITITNNQGTLVDCGAGKDTVSISDSSGLEVSGVESLTLSGVTNSNFSFGSFDKKDIYNLRLDNSDGNVFYGDDSLHISLLTTGSNNEFHFGQGADAISLKALNPKLDNNIIYVDKLGKATDVIDLSTRNAEDFRLAAAEGGYVLMDRINQGKLYIMTDQADPHMKVVFKNGVEQAILRSAPVEGTISPLEVIQRLMSSYNNTQLTGSQAWDEALAYASNNYYSNFKDMYNALSNDINKANNLGWSTDWTLQELYGIDLNNKDTGAINGFDANGGPVKDNHSIIVQPTGMTLQDFVYDTSHTALLPDFSYKTFGGLRTNRDSYYVDIDGVRFYWNDYVIDKVANQFCSAKYETESVREAHPDLQTWVKEKKADMRQMIAGFTTTWAKGAMDQIKAAYGLSLTDPTAKENGNTFTSEGKPLVGIGFYCGNTGTKARTYINNGLYLEINLNYYQSIADVNGTRKVDQTIYDTAILENTITHELTHAVMAANIKDFTSTPFFFQEGAADLVIGDDSHRASSIQAVSTDLSQYIDLNDLGNRSNYAYAGGYALLRYLAKSVSEASGYQVGLTVPTSLGESLAEVDFGALQASLLDFGGNSLAVGDAALECQAMEEKASNKILAYSHC